MALTPKPSKASKSIEETYVKLSHLDQILTRPDTYIGSIEAETEDTWVYEQQHDSDSNTVAGRMVYRKCTIVPGLFKIFDEILVNAADHKQRDNR